MYRYTIGEDSYEEYHEYELLHKLKYTKEEFINLCKEAFKKLDFKNKKEIAESYGSIGTHYFVELLIDKYGFVKPDDVIQHIHISQAYDDNYVGCEDCAHSYYLNEKLMCNSEYCNECDWRDEEKF